MEQTKKKMKTFEYVVEVTGVIFAETEQEARNILDERNPTYCVKEFREKNDTTKNIKGIGID